MPNKIAQYMSNIRNNLTTEEMKELAGMMNEEVKASEKIHLHEVKSNLINDEPDDDLIP
jgi:uncharacterized tellurite resistance protein B-like protein